MLNVKPARQMNTRSTDCVLPESHQSARMRDEEESTLHATEIGLYTQYHNFRSEKKADLNLRIQRPGAAGIANLRSLAPRVSRESSNFELRISICV